MNHGLVRSASAKGSKGSLGRNASVCRGTLEDDGDAAMRLAAEGNDVDDMVEDE
jgi:hypothetical protein